MLKRVAFFILLAIPASAYSQIGVDFHFSNMPFFGVHYELWERVRPEVRLGTDTYLEDVALELIVTYDILKKADYELYAGLGYRDDPFAGLVIPIGLNFYPFQERKFGFHVEMTPIIGEADVLRGTLGIRYKFISSTED
jgi:hypothetical protein